MSLYQQYFPYLGGGAGGRPYGATLGGLPGSLTVSKFSSPFKDGVYALGPGLAGGAGVRGGLGVAGWGVGVRPVFHTIQW